MAGGCTYCQKPIDARTDYQRTVGWARKRDSGGLNALRARETKTEWACTSCVDKLARKIDPGQQDLFG